MQLIADRWTRTGTETHPRKKNAAVKLTENGRTGFAIDFSSMSETAIWREGGEQKERDLSADNAARSARIAARGASEREGKERARKAYTEAIPLRGVST